MIWNGLKKLITLTTITLAANACMYHPMITQGKQISENELNQLHLHMSQDQVAALIGKPLLKEDQTDTEWRYIKASTQNLNQEIEQVILTFKNQKLAKIDKKTFKNSL